MRAVVRLHGRPDRGTGSAEDIHAQRPGLRRRSPRPRTELAADGYNVLWTPGDRIGVYVKSGDTFTSVNVPLTFEGAEAAAGGTFSGEITLTEGASGYTLYAYYPWSEQASDDASAVAFTLETSQVQAAAGDSSHLGDSDFLVAGAVGSATGDFPALAFRHAFAVVEVSLTASGTMAGKRLSEVTLYCSPAATVDSGGNLGGMSNLAGAFSFDLTAASGNNAAAYAGGSAEIDYCSLALTESPALGSEPVKVWLTVNPADYSRGGGKVYVVVRTEDGYTATYTRPGLVIAAAQMKVITQDVASGAAPQPAVDLSGGGERANCYVASVAGQEYSFDATVAGNGVISQALAAAVGRYEGRTLSRPRCRERRPACCAEQPPADRSCELARGGWEDLFHADVAPCGAGRQRRHRPLRRRVVRRGAVELAYLDHRCGQRRADGPCRDLYPSVGL